ncbi:Hypothetical protein, putative [Bodo saltans]|uniref:Uncharacterized protein n=1 Tax=Bodo saltans TaxID=75058 RepID=A0A0S4JEM5_BODSA|nr:Hypothetical protein, putative [Bodo saltans]|eukprot:CUG90038.1 Hypothetical protein, putative [Bodo saltans]
MLRLHKGFLRYAAPKRGGNVASVLESMHRQSQQQQEQQQQQQQATVINATMHHGNNNNINKMENNTERAADHPPSPQARSQPFLQRGHQRSGRKNHHIDHHNRRDHHQPHQRSTWGNQDQAPQRRVELHHSQNNRRRRPNKNRTSFPLEEYIIPGSTDTASESISMHLHMRLSKAIAMKQRLSEAEHLWEQLSTFGCNSGKGEDSRLNPFMEVSRRCPPNAATASATTLSEIAEERCGIVGRVHRQRQRQKMRAVSLMLPSDVQLSELLSSGRVVTLTHITQPTEVAGLFAAEMKRAHVRSSHKLKEELTLPGDDKTKNHSQQTQQQHNKATTTLFAHFVLHKSCMSWSAAVELLSTAAGVPPTLFSVNTFLDDQGCTTQLCSVELPRSVASENDLDGQRGPHEDATAIDVLSGLFRLNAQPVALRLQWIGIRDFACSDMTSSVTSAGTDRRGFRCNLMLRGFAERPSAIRAAAKRAASLFPNYFAPRRFFFGDHGNSLQQPFCWYHVSEAISRKNHQVALAMLVHMYWFAAGAQSHSAHKTMRQVRRAEIEALFAANVIPSYPNTTSKEPPGGEHNQQQQHQPLAFIRGFANLVRGGETSSDRYKQAYQELVPPGVQQLVRTSRYCLVFNAMLSLRLLNRAPVVRRSQMDRDEEEGSSAFQEDDINDDINDDMDDRGEHRTPINSVDERLISAPREFDLIAIPRPPAKSQQSVAPISPPPVVVSSTEDDVAQHSNITATPTPTLSPLTSTLNDITSWFDTAAETEEKDDTLMRGVEGDNNSSHNNDDDGQVPLQAAAAPATTAAAAPIKTLLRAGLSMGGEPFAWKPELCGTAPLSPSQLRCLSQSVRNRRQDDNAAEILRLVQNNPLGSSVESQHASVVAAAAAFGTIGIADAQSANGSDGAVVVLPLGVVSPSSAQLWENLGLTPPLSNSHRNQLPLTRRAFLGHQSTSLSSSYSSSRGGGEEGNLHQGDFPVRLRTVPEVGNALSGVVLPAADPDDDGGDGIVRLATDVELLRSAKQGRRYGGTQSAAAATAAISKRGGRHERSSPSIVTWAIGRRGHMLSDRLPVGAFATDASTLNSGGAGVSSGRRGGSGASSHGGGGGGASTTTTSLALQFDVPLGCYVSSMLREFVALRRPSSATTHAASTTAASSRNFDTTTARSVADLKSKRSSAVVGASADTTTASVNDVEGNLLALTLRGNVTLEDAVRAGKASDVMRSGKSVPRFLGVGTAGDKA